MKNRYLFVLCGRVRNSIIKNGIRVLINRINVEKCQAGQQGKINNISGGNEKFVFIHFVWSLIETEWTACWVGDKIKNQHVPHHHQILMLSLALTRL